MSLVSFKCPNCGEQIQLDEYLDRCFCSYCGTRIELNNANKKTRVIMEPAINNTKSIERESQRGLVQEQQILQDKNHSLAPKHIVMIVAIVAVTIVVIYAMHLTTVDEEFKYCYSRTGLSGNKR